MKTRLLRKLRGEAWNRIGVFVQDDWNYRVVFDKRIIGNVGEYNPVELLYEKSFQVVYKDIEKLSEAIECCKEARREFILREARKYRYGTRNRIY